MSGTEQTVGLIQDVFLPLDAATRYDIYFTNQRIAIVCMGRSERAEYGRTCSSLNFIAPTTTAVERENKERMNRIILEEEVGKLSMDDKLRLSKKSCYYTYEEVEEVKLVLGKKPKFLILSKDCESKFAPTEEQLKQLSSLLPTIDALNGKLSEAGSWVALHQTAEASLICGVCGFRNDQDAVFCQCCGKKTEPNATPPSELVCGACGTKNRSPVAYCKKCATPI